MVQKVSSRQRRKLRLCVVERLDSERLAKLSFEILRKILRNFLKISNGLEKRVCRLEGGPLAQVFSWGRPQEKRADESKEKKGCVFGRAFIVLLMRLLSLLERGVRKRIGRACVIG